MKKLILFLTLIFVLIAGPVFAAGTVTGSVARYEGRSGLFEWMKITYTVTFGADNAAPANVALHHILDSSGVVLESPAGWILQKVDITYATTGPTDDTDFYLWAIENKIDILGGNGVDQIDNATNNSFYPAVSTQLVTGEEVFDIDNNAVNNAGCVIVLTLYW